MARGTSTTAAGKAPDMKPTEYYTIVDRFEKWALSLRFPRNTRSFLKWLETTPEGQEVVRKLAAELPPERK